MDVALFPFRRVIFGCLTIVFILFLIIAGRVSAQEDALSTPQPIAEGITAASGIIGGTVQNGTTGQRLAGGLRVNLYAFDSSFSQTETHTTTLADDGSYQFGLVDQPTNHVYMIGVTYNDIEFTSDIGSFTHAVNALTLPVTVYEQTADSSAVVIDQLHLSMAFMDGEVQVHELYTFDNLDTAVFIGTPDSGGTLALSLPAAASAPIFQRGVGSSGEFAPAAGIVRSGSRWYDTQPLRPGPAGTTLLVSYRLPYVDALTLTHELPYDVNNVQFSLPYNGVAFADNGWKQLASRPTGAGDGLIRSYSRDNFAAGDRLTLHLSGTTFLPKPASIAANEAAWMFGVAVLLTAVTFIIRRLLIRRRAQPREMNGALGSSETVADLTARSRQLVNALTILDEGYDNGWISEEAYLHRHHVLNTELHAIWQKLDQSEINLPSSISDPLHISTPQPEA